MNFSSQGITLFSNGFIFHLRKPSLQQDQVNTHLLLHGWTGDEHSMDPFWNYFPENDWLIAPRASQAADPSGYGWAQIKKKKYPGYQDFLPSVEQLISALNKFGTEQHVPLEAMNVIGFSQGAAIAYLLAVLIPERINNIVAIAGFLPEGTADKLQQIDNHAMTINILHGAQDKLVPVQMAKDTASQLNLLGYKTTLCIDDRAGHKLGAACIPVLKDIVKS